MSTYEEIARRVIAPIWLYENSIELPEDERVTCVDAQRHLHLKAGDEHADDFREYAGKCAEYLRFGDDVDEATCGAYDEHSHLKVCDTPLILLNAGFEQKPMLYTQRHLLDAVHPKSDENYHWHGLTIPQIKHLPALLEKPVLLCDSPAREDTLLAVLCDVDSDALPLIVAIKPDGQGIYQLETIETNFILSVYGKNEFERYFEQRITPERIVFFDKEQGRKLERLAGIQFPEYYSNLDPDTIIRQPQCIVNMRRSAAENEHGSDLEHARAETPDGLDGPDVGISSPDEPVL